MPEQKVYEMPGRPNHAITQAIGWALGCTAALAIGIHESPTLFYSTVAIAGSALVYRSAEAWQFSSKQKRMRDAKVEFITIKDLIKRMPKDDALYLGTGGPWGQHQAQQANDIVKHGIHDKIMRYQDDVNDQIRLHNLKRKKDIEKGRKPRALKYEHFGAYWLHAILDEQRKIKIPISSLEGNTLIPGTTGAGKTRMLAVWILQCVLRNEPVIILDPKGDEDLENACREAAEIAGDKRRFALFDLARPESSVAINPLQNFNTVAELTNRIVSNLDDGKDPTFKNFVWQEVNTILCAMTEVGQVPTLSSLFTYVISEQAVNKLTEQVVNHHYEINQCPEYRSVRDGLTGKNMSPAARALQAHQKMVERNPGYASATIDKLASRFNHEKAHLTKLIGSLTPLLMKLTGGHLAETLSPQMTSSVKQVMGNEDAVSADDVLTLDTVVNQRMIFYVRTDALSQGDVSSVVGSIFLSDLAAYAGRRYSYLQRMAKEDGVAVDTVNLFIDESSEVINETTVALLNKGRGAKIRTVMATQALSDIVNRLGTKDQALTALGNINNIISLRVTDTGTQEYITEQFEKAEIKSLGQAYRAGTGSDQVTEFVGHVTETLNETEGDLVTPTMLGSLPNLHYIAKLMGGRTIKGAVPILVSK